MDIPILFEDACLLVVNKPPGIVVNRAQSVGGETVQDWVEKKFRIPTSPAGGQNLEFRIEDKDFYDRAGIVHRIDKETSGILIITKTPAAFTALQRQFKERTVKKTYIAIVHGDVVPQEGEIRAPVGRLPWNRQRFGILPGGREAVTKYKRIKSLELRIKDEIQHLSLLELHPETGRTHQIRVHLKYINHPIVGDYLYAGRKTARNDRAWAPRIMLHAWKLTCHYPKTGTEISFEAPVPRDMMEVINKSTNTTNLQMNEAIH